MSGYCRSSLPVEVAVGVSRKGFEVNRTGVRVLSTGARNQTAQRTAKRVDEVDPEEMERRAAHLRHQRDLLLLKKKKEQEERLRAFNEVCKQGFGLEVGASLIIVFVPFMCRLSAFWL